jgi:plastocyanin
MANETIVEIKNFAYSPNPVEIPVGATVTWINRDTVAHTATAQNRGAFQSGPLDPGDRFSQSFDQPGTFDYFCEFHASMTGTVIVQ